MTITELQAGTPLADFNRWLGEGRFRIQRCNACAQVLFYPRNVCTVCHSTDIAWHDASGRGTIYACTTIARSAEKGGPYNVVLVDLEEGGRTMSTLDGPLEDVVIGRPVRMTIVDRDGGPLLVCHAADAEDEGP